MTADNVLHSCLARTKCAIQIAAAAFEPRLEAALVDLVEKHEPRDDAELKEGNGGWLTAKPQSEKDVIIGEVGQVRGFIPEKICQALGDLGS
jgi:hypothetical protein